MAMQFPISRRQMLTTTLAGATGALAGAALHGAANAADAAAKPAAQPAPADPKVRGPFLILSTPFTADGKVDFDVLAAEARFHDWCGCSGMIWPQSGDSVDLLTTAEKMQGMEVLADASRGLRTALCLGVQGKDTAEMLAYAKHAEKLQPTAIISRPPDSGKTQDDMRQYWRALAAVVKRPVILQTTGGTAYRGPAPATQLMIELAKEFPHFGYIKEEAAPLNSRIRALVAAQPSVRCVFSAFGASGWLYESRLGTRGLITERGVYGDVIMRIWDLMQSGSDPDALRDAYAKYLLMINLSHNLSGGLRGPQLYLWKKRGVFKNMVSREYGPKNSIPAKPIVSEFKLTKEDIDEIEFRFAALKPYQKPGKPQ